MIRSLALLFLVPLCARAEDLVVLGGGVSDAIAGHRQAGDFRAEYRSGLSLVSLGDVALRPWAGLEATTRGSVWGGGGVLLEVPIWRVTTTIQTGIGAYSRGSGPKLGSTLEFRSGFEVAYRFDGGMRVGAMISHTSNAGIGRHNPGTEAIVLTYQMPLSALFGR